MNASDRIYLDYAAATPVRPDVLRAMQPYFSERFANPSAIHAEGRYARRAVDEARLCVARLLKIRTEEVTFTSGGTEANNLALLGVIEAALAAGRDCYDIEIISTSIEHSSILETLSALEARGVVVHRISVDRDGRMDMDVLETVLSEKTLLVTCAYVNSEVGVIQDVRRIVRTIEARNKKERKTYVHLDASQAPLWLPCAMDTLGVDLLTLDAGKCYGPKGVGVLAHKRYVLLRSHLFGGGQESGLRPGTENVPLIVGCAKALELAQISCTERSARVAPLRDFFFGELEKGIPDMLINGSRTHRVANNCNISIPGIDGEFAIVTLDAHGIAASTRSACAGGEKRILGASQDSLRAFASEAKSKDPMSGQPRYGEGAGSHVVAAITGDKDRANNTIRLTIGEETTEEEITHTVQVLSGHVVATRHF